MNTDVEELLREGMERFTAGVRTPAGLADAARRASPAAAGRPRRGGLRDRRRHCRRRGHGDRCGHRHRGANRPQRSPGADCRVRSPAGREGARQPAPGLPRAHVQRHLGTDRHLELWSQEPVRGVHRQRVPSCPAQRRVHPPWRIQQYLAQGTALIGGKLTGVYVTYYNQEWSRVPGSAWTPPNSACSSRGAIETSGLGDTAADWPTFIHATLDCGAATVTPHVRIGGMDTTKITGKPVTVRLPTGKAKSLREKYLRARWTLYVNPRTYLPVRRPARTRRSVVTGADRTSRP